MKGFTSFIFFLTLLGGAAYKGILPTLSASDAATANPTSTPAVVSKIPTTEPVTVCNHSDKDLAIREQKLEKQLRQIQESTAVTLGELERLDQELQQFSSRPDKVNALQQAASQWNDTLAQLKQTLANKGVESMEKQSNPAFDLGYSQTPEPKITVSFNPVAIITNLQGAVEQVKLDSGNNVKGTSQSVTAAKAQVNAQSANSVRQLEQELNSIRARCNSLTQASRPQTSSPQADAAYTYHSAQPDPNLPPVQAIPCNDSRIVKNPKQVCESSPGVIRMPRLNF
jgi:hypothetical protein